MRWKAVLDRKEEMVAVQEVGGPDSKDFGELLKQSVTIVITDESEPAVVIAELKKYEGEEYNDHEIIIDISGCKRYSRNGLLFKVEEFIKHIEMAEKTKSRKRIKVVGMSSLLEYRHSILADRKVKPNNDEKNKRPRGVWPLNFKNR